MTYEVPHHGWQEDICEIERQVEQLRTGMLEAESSNRKLQQEIQNAKTSEGLAKVEARAARDELKNMRRGILKVQDEYNTLRALYDAVKVASHPYSLEPTTVAVFTDCSDIAHLLASDREPQHH